MGLNTTDSLFPTHKKEISVERKVGGDT